MALNSIILWQLKGNEITCVDSIRSPGNSVAELPRFTLIHAFAVGTRIVPYSFLQFSQVVIQSKLFLI